MYGLYKRSYLTLRDFSKSDILNLLELASELKAKKKRGEILI